MNPVFRIISLQLLFTGAVMFFAQPLQGEDFILQQTLTTGVDLLAVDSPEEYRADEFGQGLRSLRRGEIIFFGSVPITFILSGMGWQLSQAVAGDGYPFSDRQHTMNILLTAGGLSLTIAMIDFILGVGEKPTPRSR